MSGRKKKQERRSLREQAQNNAQLDDLFQAYYEDSWKKILYKYRTKQIDHGQLCDLWQEHAAKGEELLELARRTDQVEICDFLQRHIARVKSMIGQVRRFGPAQQLDFTQQFDLMQGIIADRAPDIFAELPAELKTILDSKIQIIKNAEDGIITSETNALTSAELHNVMFAEQFAEIHGSVEKRLYILSLGHNYYAYQMRLKGYADAANNIMFEFRSFFLNSGNEI